MSLGCEGHGILQVLDDEHLDTIVLGMDDGLFLACMLVLPILPAELSLVLLQLLVLLVVVPGRLEALRRQACTLTSVAPGHPDVLTSPL